MADKAYAAPSGITRAGTLISELNIVSIRTRDDFFDKWKFVPYMEIKELADHDEKVDNKQFYHYESTRGMGFVVANATVVGAAGAAVVVTIATGGYAASGTRSLPEIGKIFRNSRTGFEGRVTATSKTTPNAHTFTIVPVVAAQNIGVTAGDELMDLGFKYVGAASGYTGTTVVPVEKFTNYCTQLRIDSKFDDLSTVERIDFEFEGNHFYKYKQLKDDNYRWKLQKELLLMDSQLTDNLGYAESGSAGLIQQVEANGIIENYSAIDAITTFASMERKFDAQGGQAEYDVLSDTDANIDIQTAIASNSQFSGGALVYDRNNLKWGFNSFTIMGRKYNFNRYLGFSERALWGSAAVGTKRSNFSLVLPVGTGTDAKTRNKRPMIQLKYQAVNGQKVLITESGALSTNGKTPVQELIVSQIAHMGISLFGANQAMILKKV